jgi:hypothetical protein
MSKKEETKMLRTPRLRPVNGRLVLQASREDDYEKLKSVDILIPKNLAAQKKNDDNRMTENAWAGSRYFVVAIAPEVNEQLKLEQVNHIPDYLTEEESAEYKELDTIKLGDEVMLSPYFAPIEHSEHDIVYAVIHWQDILGVNQEISFRPHIEKV